MIESLDQFADGLAGQLDRTEERILADELNTDRQLVGSVRRRPCGCPATGHASLCAKRYMQKLGQRLDWLDPEIVELRDRSRLLQEEIMLKDTEQTNRSPLLAIVTTVFLPARLVAGMDRRQKRLPVGDGDHRCRLDCRLLAA